MAWCLLDRAEDDKLAAVIDWEFTYAAPAQFVLDPPWWLLFETPDMWKPGGVDEWSKAYAPQLEIWLKAMEDQEDGAAFLKWLPLSIYEGELGDGSLLAQLHGEEELDI